MVNYFGIIYSPASNPEDKYWAGEVGSRFPKALSRLQVIDSVNHGGRRPHLWHPAKSAPFVPAEKLGAGEKEGRGIWGRELPKEMIKELICLK